MAHPRPAPRLFNPYQWLRYALPSRMRKPADFFYVSFSLSAAVSLLALGIWLDNIELHRAADSVFLADLLIAITLLARFFGLNRTVACWTYQASLLGLIFYNASYLGGVTSPTMAWLGILPFLPFFTMSRRASYLWMLASCAMVWGLYFVQSRGWLESGHPQTSQELIFGAAMFSLMCMTQMVLVASYDAFMAGAFRAIGRKTERLEKLSQELQQANSHKDKFLAMVSHDMRTPLNAIMGYLSLIQDEKNLSAEGRQHVIGANDASAQLLAVINDLLDFSQIRIGKLALSPQAVDLRDVLERAFHTLDSQARKRGLRYRMDLADNLPAWVRLDPFRLTQMLNNLLGNAIKFTPNGYVTLSAELDVQQDVPWLLLRVRDSGIGIALEEHKHIFEPFVQVTHAQEVPTPNDNMRGIGLGLSITHSLAQSFGGTLSLHSQTGQGSVFTLRLPLEITAAPQTAPGENSNSHSVDDAEIRLLVIDDNPVNRLLATTVLKRAFTHATIDQAPGGIEGLRLMSSQTYDLVLIDLIMPDMHGAEAVRRLRSEADEPFRSVPVIALTANLAEDARRECVEAGVNDIMPKPFDRGTLIQQVRRYAIYKHHPPSPSV